MIISKTEILFYTSFLFAIWFAWGGMLWLNNYALIIGYPVGLASLLIWFKIRKEKRKRTKWIPNILIAGLILSLGVLAYRSIWG